MDVGARGLRDQNGKVLVGGGQGGGPFLWNCLPRLSVVRYLSKGGESGEGGVDVFGRSGRG